jgi:hypothetical protein
VHTATLEEISAARHAGSTKLHRNSDQRTSSVTATGTKSDVTGALGRHSLVNDRLRARYQRHQRAGHGRDQVLFALMLRVGASFANRQRPAGLDDVGAEQRSR